MEHKNCRLFMITGTLVTQFSLTGTQGHDLILQTKNVLSYLMNFSYFKIRLFARFLACAFYFWVNFCPFVGLNVDSLL